MRVKVLKRYKDKYTHDFHKEDEILTISSERYQEINGTALGIFVEEVKEKKKPTKKVGD